MNGEVNNRTEQLVVIGGGLEGSLAALFAARVKDKQGRPKYKVTLLESKEDILGGSSQLAARLHLGGEYPKDFKTGKDCLWGAAIWKLIFPEKLTFTDQPPMRFLVAKQTQADPSAGVTLESYTENYEKLKQQYRSVIDFLYQKLKEDKAKGADAKITDEKANWGKDDLARALFGKPEDFYRKLSDKELEWYKDPYGESNIAGGLQTQEMGLRIPEYLETLGKALQDAGVTIRTKMKVDHIQEGSSKGHKFTVFCSNGASFHTDQIIQAAWESGLTLDGEHRLPHQHKQVQIYRRAVALVDIRDMKDKPPPSFTLLGEHGGMYCPIDDKWGIVYHPVAAHLDTGHLNSKYPWSRRLPEETEKAWSRPIETQQQLRSFKRALVNGPYPFLKDAKFKDLRIRTTLNFQQNIEQRRHEETAEIKPGYHVMYATKATLAPRSAIEAVEALKARSDLIEQHHERDTLPKITASLALAKALEDPTYQLQGALTAALNRTVKRSLDISKEVAVAASQPSWTQEPLSAARKTGEVTSDIKVPERPFGQGFGRHKISVYTKDSPKTGPIFDADEHTNAAVCQKIKDWAHSNDPRPLTDIVEPALLSKGFSNRLLHADTLDLITWFKDPKWKWPESFKTLLFSKQNVHLFPHDVLHALRDSRDDLPRLVSLFDRTQSDAIIDPTARLPAETIAMALPIVFATLDEPSRAIVTKELTEALHAIGKDRRFLAPLMDPDINRIIIKPAAIEPPTDSIFSNGRALQVDHQKTSAIDPANDKVGAIHFQGKDFQPLQFHFHRTRNILRDEHGELVTDPVTGSIITSASVTDKRSRPDGSFEFRIYEDRKHENRCQRGAADPNDNAVGELHAIYMHKDPHTGYKTALAMCAHVKLGEKNEAFERYIEQLRGFNHPLEEKDGVKPEKLPFDPLSCFNKGSFTPDKALPEAPFASLNLGGFEMKKGRAVMRKDKSDVFYRGVHVVHLPDTESVTISPDQLERLQELQPTLSTFPNRLAVNPVGRAAGYSVDRQR